MPTPTAPQSSKPSLKAAGGKEGEQNSERNKKAKADSKNDDKGTSSMETLPDNEELSAESQKDGDDAQSKAVLLSEEKKHGQKLLDATAAGAHRLQSSLKGLMPWIIRRGSGNGHPRVKASRVDRGSSPPDFVLNLTVTWPGCQSFTSFTAADLGAKIALWAVESPDGPAALVLYDPKTKILEQELDFDVEPDAVTGVTLTFGELQTGKPGALVFGGRTQAGKLVNASWFYNIVANNWTKLKCDGKVPKARCNHAAAFSSKTRSFYIFGGEGEESTAFGGTYQLAGGQWKEVPARREPPARTHHSLSTVCDTTGEECLLLFGGLVEGTVSNDLWSLGVGSNEKSWSQIVDAAGTPPAPRHGHSAIPSDARCFIFGGLGKHWMGWEVSFFDLAAFDVEVHSWFEIPLLSPLASTQTHRYAVATGDPSSSFHVFATGATANSDGAVYRVGAVCSTLDVSVISRGMKDINVVTKDNKQRVSDGLAQLQNMNTTASREENVMNSLATRADKLADTLNKLLLRMDQTYQDIMKKVELARTLGARAEDTVVDAAAHESNARIQSESLDKKLRELSKLVEQEMERLAASAPSRSSSESDESD